MFVSLCCTLSTGLLYLLIRWFINKNGLFNNSSDEEIAKWAGIKLPHIADRLLNTLQLEKTLLNQQKQNDLAQVAIDKTNEQIESISAKQTKEKLSNKLLINTGIFLGVILVLFIVFHNTFIQSGYRILHPKTEFPIPLPFHLESISGDINIIGGDSASIAITGIGDLPDSIILNWTSKEKQRHITIPKKNDFYNFTFENVQGDTRYWGEVVSSSWLTPWDTIKSTVDTIFVTDRPIIGNIEFTIIPPDYTGEDIKTHPGNITEIMAIEGSRISINADANKILSSAFIETGFESLELTVSNKQLNGYFTLIKDEILTIQCMDLNNVVNQNPPQYRIITIPDSPPELFVTSPDKEITLDESMLIYFNMLMSDDYGFSSMNIEYQIQHPSYLSVDTNLYLHNIPEMMKSARTQQIFHSWDLKNLRLDWEDELHFRIHLADNNSFSGPSVTISPLFIARYPSMEDLFEQLEEEENFTTEETEEILMTLEDIEEMVEDLQLEMLKAEDVNWEQTQKTQETLDKMEDVLSQVQQIQEQLELISELSEKNDLVSDDLQEKFSKLQEMLESIMTPELMEAMEKLREAMEELDPEKMLEALEDFEFNIEEFEEQLDRFLEMFEMAMAEQKMDEIVKRLEEMLEEQTEIVDELRDKEDSELSDLASRERRQEENFSNLQDAMKDAQTTMENVSPSTSEKLEDLKESKLSEETSENLTDARKSMQENDSQNSEQSASQAKENLEQMLSQAKSIQSAFQKESIGEMMRDFQKVLHNALSISKRQEKLKKESKGIRANSPKLAQTAYEQDAIRRQTNQLILQVSELSKKTFYITPDLNRAIGGARMSMDKSILSLEQKKTGTALNEQKKAMSGINDAAKLLLSSMEQMQQSGSASGFESFMEQLGEMSGQQQQINQGTQQMMQLSMMAQQQMMQRLQQQQQQLQQALEEMLGEYPSEESGGLGKAKQEMEEVIKDFKRKQVNQRTIDRQEKILSRMLDSQKSLTQKDYSEKRKSDTGEKFIYSGPSGLPSDFGEREILLMKAMEEALKEGYSREYQELMKIYFRELQKHQESNDD
ncbi:MAG: hypothetical protein ISS11_04500 [Candidatus Marinimicrobia bacterium]|nr:hypothetical protein [Candidatus Neomarinimicrobiota bacterium]